MFIVDVIVSERARTRAHLLVRFVLLKHSLGVRYTRAKSVCICMRDLTLNIETSYD